MNTNREFKNIPSIPKERNVIGMVYCGNNQVFAGTFENKVGVGYEY